MTGSGLREAIEATGERFEDVHDRHIQAVLTAISHREIDLNVAMHALETMTLVAELEEYRRLEVVR